MKTRQYFLDQVEQTIQEYNYAPGAILTKPSLKGTLQEKIIFYLKHKDIHITGGDSDLFNYLLYLFNMPLTDDEAINWGTIYDQAFDMMEEYFTFFVDSLASINIQWISYVEQVARSFFLSLHMGDIEAARKLLDSIQQVKEDTSS